MQDITVMKCTTVRTVGPRACSKFWGVARSEDFACATLPTTPLIFKAKFQIFVTPPSFKINFKITASPKKGNDNLFHQRETALITAYKLYMEYKTTTKLRQSTLWRRLKLVMTHNFTELKAEELNPLHHQ